MNCDHADNLILDELYGELDEGSRPALEAHLQTCAACRASKAKLTRGKEAASALPSVDAPDSLEARILAMLPEAAGSDAAAASKDADPDAQQDDNAGVKVVQMSSASRRSLSPSRRFFSAAGNWAMRPQTAMAAVFLLMVGTSTLALRMKHKNSEAAMSVTEQGSPIAASLPAAAEDEERPELAHGGTAHGVALARRGAVTMAPSAAVPMDIAPSTLERPYQQEPLANAAAPAGAAGGGLAANGDGVLRDDAKESAKGKTSAGEGEFGNAMSAYNARNFSEAIRRFDALAAHGDKQAALWAARSVRAANGCSTALTRFDHLASTAFGTPAGYDATMEAGVCYRELGYLEAASSRFQRLLNVPSHADAARAALETVRQIASRRADEMKGLGEAQAGAAHAGGMAAPKAAPAAKPATERKAADRADPYAGPPVTPAQPPPVPGPAKSAAP